MKTRKLLLQLFAIFFVFSLISCEDDKEEIKDIAPETAKVEFRNATQEVNVEMDKMMNTISMQSLSYLSGLMDAGWDKKLKISLFQSGKLHLAKIKDNFRLDASGNRNATEVGDYGIYTFNFDLDDFELTEASSTQLKLNYPADDQAYSMRQNNAVFILDNLQYTTITYTESYWDEWDEVWVDETYQEDVPTNANVDFSIDGNSLMSGSYQSELAENGTPTAVNVSVTNAPYQFQMGLSGSGTNFNTNLSLKENNTEMMGYSWDITYTSDLVNVERLSGYYNVNPLKVQGSMNYAAIETRMELIGDVATVADVDYLNTQLAMELYHTGLDAKLGDVQFKMYEDVEYNESYPELAVIYSDGSFDWLYEVIGDNGEFKRVKQR